MVSAYLTCHLNLICCLNIVSSYIDIGLVLHEISRDRKIDDPIEKITYNAPSFMRAKIIIAEYYISGFRG